MKAKTDTQLPRSDEQPLRILLVHEPFERNALLKHALLEVGYLIVAQVSSSADLPGLVNDLKPNVIILESEYSTLVTLEKLYTISREQPCPVVIFTHDSDSEKIRSAMRAGVSAYVVDGLNSERLRPIIEVAIARFNEYQAMRLELEKAESQLAGRRDIDRAKGILMKQRGWSEDESYQALRKMAMDKGVRLAEISRQVVAIADLLT